MPVMRQFILDAPAQLRQAEEAVSCVSLTGTLKSAWLLGMGGSALSAGLISLLRTRQSKAFPWQVVRDYSLPRPLDEGSLVIALSYSGNTEETLSALAQATPAATAVVTASHGGELALRAAAAGHAHIPVPDKPEGFQPRFALPFMFGVTKGVLEKSGLLDCDQTLADLAAWLEGQDFEAHGRELGDWIGQRLPAVYTSTDYEAGVARTWRIKFNENAKTGCLWGALPEMNHNEMMAFAPSCAGQYAILLVRDPADDARVLRRYDVLDTLLTRDGHAVRVIDLPGRSVLEKAFGSLMLADWVTYYVAQARGVDAVAIPAIQDFKKML